MTNIEWVKNADGSQGRTWNPIRGCTRVSPGCGGPGPHGGCYAEVIAARFSGPGLPYHGIAEMRGGKARWTGKLAFVEEKLTEPLKVRKPTTWFVNSMSDLFHESVPDDWIDRVLAVMALCPQHTFQVLTKRADRMRAYLSQFEQRGRYVTSRTRRQIGPDPRDGNRFLLLDEGQHWPLPNVWLGVSAEDQRRADERVPDLLATPAAVRFVSAEPLLGPIDLRRFMWPVHGWWTGPHRSYAEAKAAGAECGLKRQALVGAWCTFLDWVIVGGESGPGARPMHPDWARQIRDACAASGVAFHFKQAGAWAALQSGDGEWPANAGGFIRLRADGSRGPEGWPMQLVGKKAAGRLLDGVEHNGFPEVARG